MDVSAARSGGSEASADLFADAIPAFAPPELPDAPLNGLAPSLERQRLQAYLTLVVADVAVLLSIFSLATIVYARTQFNHDSMLAAYLLLPLFQTIAFYNGTYSRDGLTDWKSASGKGLMALFVSALLLNFLAFFAKSNAEFSRVVFTAGLVGTAVFMVVLRYFIARLIVRRWGHGATNCLLIDAGGPPVELPDLYQVDAEKCGLRPDVSDPAALDRLSRYLRNMDHVIVTCSLDERVAWARVLKGSGLHGEVISNYASELGALGIVRYHLKDNRDLTTLLISAGHLGIRSRIMKRVFDLGLSLVGLILLSPVLFLCAFAIKLEDGGPVFFRQRRMGRGNTFFDIIKFRSMRTKDADTHGEQSASKDDDRITRVGRFMRRTSLDELPQLINVLKGEMSIVGPRPHALGSMAGEKMFWQVDSKYWQRHSLRPGITGLAQIRGFRGATDTERDLVDRLQSDMEYMSDWSLWGDVKIVFATLNVLVHDRAF